MISDNMTVQYAAGNQSQLRPAESIDNQRRAQKSGIFVEEDTAKAEKIQPEELLDQIKALTEDGVYSVRFEQDTDANTLVIKFVDQDTDEVIRQVPAEEVLNMKQRLSDLSGNIINTTK